MTAPPLTIDEILRRAPVIPVLIIDDVAHAVPLGRALVAGGLSVLEITLRTPVAMDCIERMAGEIEGAVVGAGTVLTAAMRRAVADVGGQFCVSPGLIGGETAEGPDAPAARDRHGHRADGRPRRRLHPLQAVPGQCRRRRRGAEGLRQPLRPGQVLPHRRGRCEERRRLPGAAQRRLRRRQLGRPRRSRPRRRLGPDHRACAAAAALPGAKTLRSRAHPGGRAPLSGAPSPLRRLR